ncbi:hypothetical protein C1645_834479, partial [Glomus cerebriforme]
FDEDEYDVWRRQDTDEVNLHYLLRIKYPRDEDEQAWHDELERLKREVSEIRIIEEGWFEGVWVPLEKAKDIAHRYNIYEHVAALLDSENSWFDTPKKQSAKVKSERAMSQMNSINSLPEMSVETTNGTSTTGGTRSISNYGMTNGTVKSDNESKSSRRRTSERIRAKSQSSQEQSSSATSTKRLREVESERDNFKEEVQNLKRKLDETEEYLNYGENSNKRRAIWAGIGAAVGAGITAVALHSMGIGLSDIATGISDFSSKFGGMFG